MRVRSLLFWTAIAVTATPAATQTRTQNATPAAREQTADQQVRHVLNRLAFGARPGDYDRVRQMGVDGWIAQQLHPEKIADPAVAQVLSIWPRTRPAPQT